jgi:hypothetical protein
MNYGSRLHAESSNDKGFTELTSEKVDNLGSGLYFIEIFSGSN